MATVQKGSTVAVEYTLYLKDGTQVETNRGSTPMVYEQGKSEIIPGLERNIEGMSTGETKRIEVIPEDAYGNVDPEAFYEVSKDNFPEESLAPGTPLKAEDKEGNVLFMWVKEVKDDSVILDLNHPLAGETLLFDVRVLDVQNN